MTNIPPNCIFRLSFELNEESRKYSCYSVRYDIDETLMISFLMKALKNKIPTTVIIDIVERYSKGNIVYDVSLTINGKEYTQTDLFYYLINAKYLIMFLSKHEYFKRLDDDVVRNRLDTVKYIMDQSI